MQGVKRDVEFSRLDFRFRIPGGAVRFDVENDQCGGSSVPSAIERRSVVISTAASGTLESADGIRSSANLDSIHWTTSLSSGFPGPIGIAPLRRSASASPRTSRRSWASRAAATGP
jgi:hypothetical protein